MFHRHFDDHVRHGHGGFGRGPFQDDSGRRRRHPARNGLQRLLTVRQAGTGGPHDHAA